MPRLLLYSKRHCPLCDEAAALLRSLAAELEASVEEVDIESDAGLRERYGDLVPVVAVEGGPLLYPPITEERLRAALGRPSRKGGV